jgi:hypothetical protein
MPHHLFFSLTAFDWDGKYTNGRFVSIPSYGVGKNLADYNDYFWNKKILFAI